MAASAQDEPTTRSLRDAFPRTQTSDGPVFYQTVDGLRRFVLDREAEGALLRFEGSPEVFALDEAAGGGGDILYRDDLGEDVVRVSTRNSVTLYTSVYPTGILTADIGPAPSLDVLTGAGDGAEAVVATMTMRSAAAGFSAGAAGDAASPRALVDDAVRALELDLQAAAGRAVPVDVRALVNDAGAAAVFADAARVTSLAVQRAQSDGDPDGLLDAMAGVELTSADVAEVDYDEGVWVIGVSPAAGFAGRPSSLRILHDIAAAHAAQ